MSPSLSTNFGPVILSTVGDTYVDPAHIDLILWEGATTAGDVAEVKCPQTGLLLFPGRAVGAQTYEGIAPTSGISAPYGFKLTRLSAGRVLVYLSGH